MMRSLFGLALFLGFVQFAGAQDTGKKITIRWYGQSFFQIETSDKTLIVTDPHAMPEYNRNVVRADLVTCSHMHSDHVQVEILENSKEAKIYYGLDPKSKRSIFNPISAKFKNVTFYDVESDHDPDGGMTRGKNAIFVFEVDGLRICHLGDLGTILDEKQIKQIGKVDILLIPIGGVYTINGEKAKEVVRQLKPRLYIIPMHYGTKVLDSLQPPDEFLEGQKNVKKLEDTNALTIPVDLKQDNPVIVLLGWK
jgi:L-ascorbate metabolism protein UlaG (beta-lactamase superfamily)